MKKIHLRTKKSAPYGSDNDGTKKQTTSCHDDHQPRRRFRGGENRTEDIEDDTTEMTSELTSDWTMPDSVPAAIHELTLALRQHTSCIKSAVEAMEAAVKSVANKSLLDEEANVPNVKREDKILVELKCTFMKINDVDTVSQKFEAEIFVQAKWEEPLLKSVVDSRDGKAMENTEELVPWDPKLIIMNVDGVFSTSRKTYDVRFHEPGYTYPVVLQMWRFTGTFRENLELEHFPVDVQDLTISISTERSDKEVELIEDQRTLSSINVKAFMDAQEWTLYKHVETCRDVTTVEYCSSTAHCILHVQCRVARKIGFFFWNVILIVLLIVSLTFSAFSIEHNSPDRLVVTITLFLTAVAFKLVVQQSLPTISYLTYLDMYVLASLIYLGVIAAQNCCVVMVDYYMNEEDVKTFDRGSVVAMAVLLAYFHLVFGTFIYMSASKRRRVMDEKDRIYESKRKYLEKYGRLPQRIESSTDLSGKD